MLSIDAFEVFIPTSRFSLNELARQTELPSSMLSIYQIIYGLKNIPIWHDSVDALITLSLDQLTLKIDLSSIHYLIYVHTASFLSLSNNSILQTISDRLNVKKCISFEMTMYKCVSYFKLLEILQIIFKKNASSSALVITGEVAFTPKLRVVPRSTIVGDASTAALLSANGKNHRLISIKNKIIPGYEDGIYLSDSSLRQFDAIFIQKMADIINEAVVAANITLNDVVILLPHNVNIPTWKKISAALYYPIAKIYLDNIAKLGHCFCSDHLINLKNALSDNRLKKGEYYLMAGCGLGFYLSAAVFQY